VLLDALIDYGGTLIIVSHDRYFVEKLATKIIEIGQGQATVYPGSYSDFLWRREGSGPPAPGSRLAGASNQGTGNQKPNTRSREPGAPSPEARAESREPGAQNAKAADREARKRLEAERRRQDRASQSLQKRITDLEGRIAEREAQVRELEAAMATPGFYEDREASKQVINRHQALMWEVGDLMSQWEALQEHASQPQRS
jgi:ATP-binding cassette subfamily F protein 3